MVVTQALTDSKKMGRPGGLGNTSTGQWLDCLLALLNQKHLSHQINGGQFYFSEQLEEAEVEEGRAEHMRSGRGRRCGTDSIDERPVSTPRARLRSAGFLFSSSSGFHFFPR